ncbi:MAG: hypothetical protein ACI88H_004154 [Cocleimonas sp.]|jgi:hypothetical protein
MGNINIGKSKRKMTNWSQYNKALVNRGSLTFWIDEQTIQSWRCTEHHGRRGRGYIYSDVAIETALVVKGVFNLSLRAFEAYSTKLQCPSWGGIGRCKGSQQNHRTRNTS